MDWKDYVAGVLKKLEGQFDAMAKVLPEPVFVDIGGHPNFRHRELSDSLLCFLKGVKLVSTLNASLLLYRNGYVQELGALARIIDDLCHDILFMAKPHGESGPSDVQVRFFKEFFQEEFDNPKDPLGSKQKRDNVVRRNLHAAFGKLAKDEINPSDGQNMVSVVHAALSGYVHGAYPHIMEMYGGSPARYHMSGMQGTPRMVEWCEQLINYTYRAIMVSEVVARKLQAKEIESSIRAILVEFETTLDCKPTEPAAKQLRKMKEKAKSGG